MKISIIVVSQSGLASSQTGASGACWHSLHMHTKEHLLGGGANKKVQRISIKPQALFRHTGFASSINVVQAPGGLPGARAYH
ncbi:MAG: hypothetical protein LBU32_22455 [Clostridiales bacterium]|nr:hypothetical protein [Clostridiales bacterium]